MISSALLSSLLLAAGFADAAVVSGRTSSNSARGHSIPLRRRGAGSSEAADVVAYWRNQADSLVAKYGGKPIDRGPAIVGKKRADTASLQLTDENLDSAYLGEISVGTPAQKFLVSLDTGSSDLWLAASNCQSGCSEISNLFDGSQSSSFSSDSTPIEFKYGGGDVSGTIGFDTVSIAGYSLENQTVSSMDVVSPGVIFGAQVSGLLGLAFPSISKTQTDPWWVNLIQANQLAAPLFGLYLARFNDDSSATTLESNGGSFDLGFANTDFYTGDISFVALSDQNYWTIPLDAITINGQAVQQGNGAAIDSGTSLIGGPSQLIAELYQNVQGAELQTSGDLAGYYSYPCSAAPSASMTFGGKEYELNSVDVSAAVDSTLTTCIGSFFPIDASTGAATWIVGDSFMKNVYSVFQADPAQVGFATVKSSDNSSGGGDGAGDSPQSGTALPPSGGSPTGTDSAGSSPTGTDNAASARLSGALVSPGALFGLTLAVVACLAGAKTVL